MPRKSPTFTLGIEEEYHLVDLETRDWTAAPDKLIAECEAEAGDQVSRELFRSQIEVGTKVCGTIAEARADLARLRRIVVEKAHARGLAPIAASTHPFAKRATLETTDKARYQKLADDLAGVARRMAISGMHVHVAIEDDELRIDLMNQARYFLPHLLMLSTSSPFWQGEDTGLKSYRLSVSQELPRSGLPNRFETWNEYQRTADVLVRSNVIEDASKIWWDLRPSAHYPTLEMRITDVCPRIGDAIAIAALFVAILRMLYRLRRMNLSWRSYPLFLINENRWRAQRYGVDGSLFDFGKGELVPFRALLNELLLILAEDAPALDCEAEFDRLRTIARDGTSADRQVACFNEAMASGMGRENALRSVVDRLVEETAAEL